MIIMSFLNLIFSVLKLLFSWMSLPDFPPLIAELLDMFKEFLGMGLGLLYCFVDADVVKICLMVVLACLSFEKVYDLLMWILAKIPIGIRKN